MIAPTVLITVTDWTPSQRLDRCVCVRKCVCGRGEDNAEEAQI